MIAVALLLSALGAGPSMEVFTGPLGLTWGQSPAEGRAALKKSALRFIREERGPGTSSLHYSGMFGGFATDDIQIDFRDGRLMSVLVVLAARDERAKTRRWSEIVEKLTEAHGPPAESTTTAPTRADAIAKTAAEHPDDPTLTLIASRAGDRYEELDLRVRRGDWKPVAKWKFWNGAGIATFVVPGPPNADGQIALAVGWFFAAPDFVKAAAQTPPAKAY